jgi:hypothetical protein
MKLLLIAATAVAFASTSAFACNVGPFAANPAGCNVYGVPMMSPTPSQPQITQGYVGGVPFSMQTFTPPNGIYYPQGYRFINPRFGY